MSAGVYRTAALALGRGAAPLGSSIVSGLLGEQPMACESGRPRRPARRRNGLDAGALDRAASGWARWRWRAVAGDGERRRGY